MTRAHTRKVKHLSPPLTSRSAYAALHTPCLFPMGGEDLDVPCSCRWNGLVVRGRCSLMVSPRHVRQNRRPILWALLLGSTSNTLTHGVAQT
eukprot:51481-Eustigmatos_ZCMA.PRE.1